MDTYPDNGRREAGVKWCRRSRLGADQSLRRLTSEERNTLEIGFYREHHLKVLGDLASLQALNYNNEVLIRAI